MRRLVQIGMLLSTLVLTASAQTKSARAPDPDLHTLRTLYVANVCPEDERGIEKLIANRLNVMGYQCTSGDAQAPASPVDAIVTYEDHWMWDITMYKVIKLDIQVHD